MDTLAKAKEMFEEIEDLQKQAKSCKDPKQAILIQGKLVELLKETFQDKEMLAHIMMANQAKNKNKE